MSKNTSLKKASIKQLEHEINKRKNDKIAELKNKRNAIDEEIKNISGVSHIVVDDKSTPVKVKIKKSMQKGRAVNEKSLNSFLIEIASDGKHRTKADFIKELTDRGWKTTSAKPYNVVAATLSTQEKKNIFRRVDKDFYELVKNNKESENQ